MVPEQNGFVCGDEISIVIEFDARHRGSRIQRKNLSGKPATIGVVGNDVSNHRSESDQQGGHSVVS